MFIAFSEEKKLTMDVELYTVAATILKQSRAKEGCLKKLIFESNFNNIPKLTAFTSEFVKHIELLEEVFSHCQGIGLLKEDVVKGKREVALALLHEQLLGNKFGKNVGLRKLMLKYKDELRSAVDKVTAKYKVKSLQELSRKINSKSDNIKVARFLRVNLLHASLDDVIKQFQEEEWEFVGKIENDNFKDRVLSLRADQFGLDPLLFDVLVFPVGTVLFNHHLINSGILIQQDKASCMPAHVLNPPSGSVVLDCCAAPGNKTSHLACLMKDEGSIIAMDRDLKRMKTMAKMLTNIGTTSVQLVHQDFLTVSPDSEDAKNVQYILVDPSCSGSGMLGVQQKKDSYDADESRLNTLSRFQITILRHALSFPNAQRVVYSTCSIHQEENEQVVEQAMSHFSDQFQFTAVFPQCKNRGVDGYPHSKYFLRLSPENDLTQGFFVACFQRKEPTSARRALTADKLKKEEAANIRENRKRKNAENLADSVEKIDKDESRTSKKKKPKSEKGAVVSKDHLAVDVEIEGGLMSIPPENKKHKKYKSSSEHDNETSRGRSNKRGKNHDPNNQDQNLDIETARKNGHGNTHSDKRMHTKKQHISLTDNNTEPPVDVSEMKMQKKCDQDNLDNDLGVQVKTKNSGINTQPKKKNHKKHKSSTQQENGQEKNVKKYEQDSSDSLHQNTNLQIESSGIYIQPNKKNHKKPKSSTDPHRDKGK